MAVNVNVQSTLTATTADVLAGTDLESLPGPGVLQIYGVSTQADSTVSVTPPGEQSPARSFTLPQKTVPTVNANDDQPLAIVAIMGAGRCIVSLTEVTAATMVFLFVFTPAEDFIGA